MSATIRDVSNCDDCIIYTSVQRLQHVNVEYTVCTNRCLNIRLSAEWCDGGCTIECGHADEVSAIEITTYQYCLAKQTSRKESDTVSEFAGEGVDD